MKLYTLLFVFVIVFLTLAITAPLLGVDQTAPLIYVFPEPGSRYISPSTSLIFREGGRFDLNQLNSNPFLVRGSRSGEHTGALALSTDSRTIIYYPDQSFDYDEVVTVEVLPGLTTIDGTAVEPSRHDFQTLLMPFDEYWEQVGKPSAAHEFHDLPLTMLDLGDRSPLVTNSSPYFTHPDLSNTMSVTVTVPADGTASGLIFIANGGLGGISADDGLIILDDKGDPVYLTRTAPDKIISDFKVQVVNGSPYLVYHEGQWIRGYSEGKYYVMDDTYAVVDVWEMKNGYFSDLHELQLLDNGNGLLLAYVRVPMDLSSYGGPAEGAVIEIVIQELDSAKNVVLEWHSLDHIPITDTFVSLMDSPVDYMHSNAIEIDKDGNLLVSNRNTSDIIKIDRSNGNIIWRLGGKSNQFDFINDEGFSFQHDIRRLANGNITLFDNGNLKPTPYSRAVEYAIAESEKTITRVWQYPDTQDIYAAFMGNVQRVNNGNTMIGWGSSGKLEEVKPDGTVALEIVLEGMTYRAFRQEWDAIPIENPRVAVKSIDESSAMLYASWNGATQITGYEIYSGETVDSLTKKATAPRSGFETAVHLTDLAPNSCVFKVRPVHALGGTMPFSGAAYRVDQPVCLDLLTNDVYLPVVFLH